MKHIRDTRKGRRDMSIGEKILLCIFAIGLTIFLIGAGLAIAWMVLEDTALGRAIDEIVAEHIERWRHGKSIR